MDDIGKKGIIYSLFLYAVLVQMFNFVNCIKINANNNSNCSNNFNYYEEVYYYGTLIDIINNVSDVNKCCNLCVNENECLSLNHNSKFLICELMSDVGDPIFEKGSFLTTMDSIFATINCKTNNRSRKESPQFVG